MSRLRGFWNSDRGTTAIEYCLIAAVVSLSVIGGVRIIGSTLNTKYFKPIATTLS